jgi:hypothetical protein
MKIVFAASVVVMLGIVLISCSDDKDSKFSIDNFTVTAVKGFNGSYAPAAPSIKVSDVIFILRVTNPVSGTSPGTSKQTVTSFTITSDSTLYTSVGDIAPNTDLTSRFQASDQINGTHIYNWDHQFGPAFLATKKQKHNFKFNITLDDGRSFTVQPGFYELLPE